jgi:hypothetical protein
MDWILTGRERENEIPAEYKETIKKLLDLLKSGKYNSLA